MNAKWWIICDVINTLKAFIPENMFEIYITISLTMNKFLNMNFEIKGKLFWMADCCTINEIWWTIFLLNELLRFKLFINIYIFRNCFKVIKMYVKFMKYYIIIHNMKFYEIYEIIYFNELIINELLMNYW